LEEGLNMALKNSFMISADMAHGVHPNYSEKHQTSHIVYVNKGVVIKTNDNQNYATDSVSRALLRELANKRQVLI
jgi:aspartyl aminopeptidase